MARNTHTRVWLLLSAVWCTMLPTCFTSSPTVLPSFSLAAPHACVAGARKGSLRLRGGGDDDVMVDPPPGNPRDWAVKDVLSFVEGLRHKFGERTDVYKTLMEENDVDGKVLLGLSPSKLQQIGMKSLGHREFFTEQVLNLRSAIGLKVGPAPGQFEAAMAAQAACKASKPPPLVQAIPGAGGKEEKWESIERVAWDQEGRNVDFYVFLDGVGGVAKEDLEVKIDVESIRVKVRNLDGRNYHYHLHRLYSKIKPENSFWKVKKDAVCFKLFKLNDDRWPKLQFDAKDAEQEARMREQMKGDPANAIVEMMRGVYEGGDDDMKRTIAKAWTESQERQARGDPSPWRDGV